MKYPKTWNIHSLLHGNGVSYEKALEALRQLSKKTSLFIVKLPDCLPQYEELMDEIHEAGSLIAALSSTDVQNPLSQALEATMSALEALFHSLDHQIDHALLDMSEKAFQACVNKMPHLAFILNEKRMLAKDRMPLDKELFLSQLTPFGHASFSSLYYTLIGSLKFPFEKTTKSIAEIENILSSPQREKRLSALESMEITLKENASLFGQFLNNIIGFRLAVYKNRGWSDVLHESLSHNRTQKKTLETMWKVVSQNKQPLYKYMERKQKLLHVKSLSWADLEAPLDIDHETTTPWELGCDNIIHQFKKVSPKLAQFAKHALSHGWVDAEVSKKKRAGGFCTNAPLLKESRILMTYTDTFTNQSTLAHELGHAFHNEALKMKSSLLRLMPMNIAEAASTMCEMIVADNAIKETKDPKKKLVLLDDKISSYLAFNMNLHMRYLFETELHKKAQEGFISPEDISSLCLKAQKEAYAHYPLDYFPHFWCYKMHFYFTDVTFYNWPYTFGYLFSLGTYIALQKTGSFEDRYIDLLSESCSMTIEDLAKKHLGVDLTEPTFWQDGIDILNANIEEFLKLSG